MKIKSINSYAQHFELTRPYKIAYKTQTTASNVIVEIETDKGKIGLGAASPSPEVTNETWDACLQSLTPESLAWCLDQDLNDFISLKRECLAKLSHTPAACAAVDIALHDLYAQIQGKPLVEVLGRVHHQLPTSITIGIKNVQETLQEAAEYIARGFQVLKVKLGCDLNEDIERLAKLREQYGANITIRVDPNQGYTFADLLSFINQTKYLNIEFIEQPLSPNHIQDLLRLPKAERQKIALDESLLNPADAIQALIPAPHCGIFNIKLMKCGGIYASQQIATIAEAAQIALMWGCMDESIISIAAALHVAFSSSATRYIDLDGSLDLASDIVTGGFNLKNGVMSVTGLPGLGVSKVK